MDHSDHGAPGGRILAIDYGRRRIGLAISDPTGTIATGLGCIEVQNDEEALNRITAGHIEWGFRAIIVGLPISESGVEGPMAAAVRAFAERLRERTRVEVRLVDERYTSREAMRIFHQTGKKLKGRKGEIDRLAAEILLRNYLDSLDAASGYDPNA
ncbi:MAG TPA: Holliday junction resolvase RuvX [bacterium]|nr:Holliday junction resolvase RuvX [bacterium]